ncbi:MAG TPA: DUF4911 domain-containing protein [Syntrophomonadaceae bacterium]|nr:DUF4911 domain-containing protein [Syntrophomonadaceae bacterium]
MHDQILGRVNPLNIDMLSKIIEAYEHLGIVTTLDRHRGLVVVRCTPDTHKDILHILSSLPFPITLFISPE